MERSTRDLHATSGEPLTSLLLVYDGHRFHCMAERGLRSHTWIVRMDGHTLRFVRTKRELDADEVRALAIAAYEEARAQGQVG